jgi:predicted nucleotidyltransferase
MNIDFVDELKRYLIEKYEPHLIILYGSYVRGDYTQESDIDIICFTEKNYSGNDTSTLCGMQLDAWIYKFDSMKNIEQYLHVKDGKILYDKFSIGNNFLDAIDQIYKKGPEKLDEKQKLFLKNWLIKMLKRSKKSDFEGNYRFHWMLKDSLEIYFNLRCLWYLGPKRSLEWLKQNDVIAYSLFESAFDKNAKISDVEKLIDYINK